MLTYNPDQYRQYPTSVFKVEQWTYWTFLYSIMGLVLGMKLTLTIVFVHTVLIPFLFLISKNFRTSMINYHFWLLPPGLDHRNPRNFGLQGARNLYLRYISKKAGQISLGVWHMLPTSVHQKVKTDLMNSTEDEIREIFDNELRNTKVPVVIYFHGTTMSRALDHRVELYKILQELGVHVIAFDPRGFGDSSPVIPDKPGHIEDAVAVFSWVRSLVGDKTPVFVWGHSLGSAIVVKCFSALQRHCEALQQPPLAPPKGIILESSFSNIYVLLELFPVAKVFSWLPYYEWLITSLRRSPDIRVNPQDYVQYLRETPVLMFHARDDDVIPFDIGTQLYGHFLKYRTDFDATVKFKEYLTGGHGYVCRNEGFQDIVAKFIESYK